MMTGWANIDCFFWCFRGRVENVMAYKIMKGIDRVDSQRFFPRMEMSITREHSFKMRGEKFKDDVKGSFILMQRIVAAWNVPSGEVVEAETILMFKRHLDKHANRQGIERYGS